MKSPRTICVGGIYGSYVAEVRVELSRMVNLEEHDGNSQKHYYIVCIAFKS